MTLGHVLKPLTIKGLTLKNRVVRTGHGTCFASGQALTPQLMAYHLARARGGVGLTILEILSVHWTTPLQLRICDELVPSYREFMAMIRPYGMAVFQQLWHGGHNAIPPDGSPPWSASDVPSVLYGVVPRPMSKADIDEVIGGYADAAALCEEGGVHGVEIHCAHGYLPQQFLSPLTNRRDDEYGGSFDNRIRFATELLRAVRARVSKDFIVGVRVSPEPAGGLTPADIAAAVRRFQNEALIDFVDVSMGNYNSFHKIIAAMHEPVGYQMPTSSIVAAAAQVPVIVTGRFRTLEEADQVIAHGEADLVGMTRAHIADPDIVAKTIAGRVEEVRPCIACNQGCIGATMENPFLKMGCTVNPVVGFEADMAEDRLAPAHAKKRVLVVGGGPAGMEAARLAVLRGHQVILAEAAECLGGTLALARRAPRRHGIGDIADWLEHEIYRLGVEVRLSTYLEADDVPAIAPDAVIIATGATPRMDGWQMTAPGLAVEGFAQRHVVSSGDLFADPRRDWGAHALVYDDVGHYEGIAAAEHLVDKGLHVAYVTGQAAFARFMEYALSAEPALERLGRHGRFRVLTKHRLVAVARSSASVAPLQSSKREEIPADVVVFISHNRPNRELADALRDNGAEVHVVGDANIPRFLHNAIREGHMAGRAV